MQKEKDRIMIPTAPPEFKNSVIQPKTAREMKKGMTVTVGKREHGTNRPIKRYEINATPASIMSYSSPRIAQSDK